ncbi:MAG: hypothetical protein OEY97_06655 [Nitrospirota bacterium]|nr:hypothetical protein [Nitrospirota bacterium]
MNRVGRLLACFSVFSLLAAALPLLAPAPALAHSGHAGPVITFLDEREALKGMLPDGAKITRRKQDLDGTVHTYFLARSGDGGPVAGAAMTRTVKVEHGEVSVAVGVDADGNVTQAAVLSSHRKYVPQVTAEAGKGVIDTLSGVSVAELAKRAAASGGETGRAVLSALHEMARALVALSAAAGQ